MKCKIKECENKKFSFEYCVKHYKRLKRNGDPEKLVREFHGMSKSREYCSWHMMKIRCLNKKSKLYKNYGGRGIKICDSWINSFENFYKDMGDRPNKKTLDRIDNNGNYEPKNCRWATYKKQNNNRRKRSDNISGIVGVSWYKPSKKWVASITINGKVKNLGYFNKPEDARDAYLKARNIKLKNIK